MSCLEGGRRMELLNFFDRQIFLLNAVIWIILATKSKQINELKLSCTPAKFKAILLPQEGHGFLQKD